MAKTKCKTFIRNCLLIFAGCFIYAIGIGLFLDKNNLTPGGVSGLAIALNHLMEKFFGIDYISTGAIIVICNIPIMLLGIWKFKLKFFVSTVVAVFLSSAMIDAVELYFDAVTNDLLIASIIGGACMSLGIGLIFRAGATTGGTDVIVRLLRLRFKHIKTGEMFWFIDGAVVIISALAFERVDVVLYAVFTLAVQTFVIDAVLYGTDSAKLVYIISDRQAEITDFIITQLEAGVTIIKGQGAFSGSEKKVIMCVMRKQLLPRVRDFVADTDPDAFMIVTKATEIYGEGYKRHDAEEI